ncbi:DUF3263 domain-containing protein [Streptomyces axinellae]|uniref:DUF3263 domain-containing protein n=1 Tax=Streptomyces axinellae TaxID=552788 RepID=A0ABN3QCG1_9ACTN
MSGTEGGSAGQREAAGQERGAGLTDEDRAVLDFAARGWSSPGAKERAIRERLGMSPVWYYQLLNALLDEEAAVAYAPVTVNRLRRARERGREAR